MIRSRAWTASACGSSKSLSEPSSEKTGSANAAAATTSTAKPARIAPRRLQIRDATRDSRTALGRSLGLLLPLGPRCRPLVLAHDLAQVERRDQVQQHPVGEEVPRLAKAYAGQAGDVPHELAVAVAHGLLELRIRRDRIGLHLEAQRVAVGQQPVLVRVA